MKKLLTIIALSLFFITPSQADDIKDFEIEGISIGESAIDFFTKSEIKKYSRSGNYKDKSFIYASIPYNKNGWTKINFHYKKKDKNYTIYALSGIIYFKDNYSQCLVKQTEIEKDISPLLKSFKKKYMIKKGTPDAEVVKEIFMAITSQMTIMIR